jgi:hypothetical protein
MSENSIPKSAFADMFAALAVSGFLLLTAWGNAMAMFVISLLGLVIGIALLPRNLRRDAIMIAAVGAVVACAASFVLLFLLR